jgi:hypothetical protein
MFEHLPSFIEFATPIQKIGLILQTLILFSMGFVISLWYNSKRRQQRDYLKINRQLDHLIKIEKERKLKDEV